MASHHHRPYQHALSANPSRLRQEHLQSRTASYELTTLPNTPSNNSTPQRCEPLLPRTAPHEAISVPSAPSATATIHAYHRALISLLPVADTPHAPPVDTVPNTVSSRNDLSWFFPFLDATPADNDPLTVLGRLAPAVDFRNAVGHRSMKPLDEVKQMAVERGLGKVVERYGASLMESDLEVVGEEWERMLKWIDRGEERGRGGA